MSTGMATLGEIDEAVRAARGAGAKEIALLKCTSAYPAAPAEMNLRTIPHLAAAFGVPVGLSDHTLGIAVPVAAVALGACIVEKHLTLSRSLPGPDTAFSLEPGEFKEMVAAIRLAEQALGEVRYELTEQESGQPGVPPLPVRGARYEGRRDFYPGERALHPPGPRPAAQVSARSPGPEGRSGYPERHAFKLRYNFSCLSYCDNFSKNSCFLYTGCFFLQFHFFRGGAQTSPQ